ncbi:MAG TPA: hypothetical protein VHE78_08375 [Gemmatimonadaceae bacterium]|nr:hypothetical protein [Gemmatimonadaceae bacterium]
MPASSQRVVVARLGTPVGEILRVDPVGEPLPLPDGRIEQRYRVLANVAFTLAGAASDHDAVALTEGGAEAPLAAYVGRPGFHAGIRVRTTGPIPPRLSAQARPAPSGHGGGSGR